MSTLIYNDKMPYFSGSEYMQIEPVSTEIILSQFDLISSEPTHGHDDIELIYILSGNGELIINGTKHELTVNSMAHLLPYHIHTIKPNKGETMKVIRCRYSLSILMKFSLTHRARQSDRYIFDLISPVIKCNENDANIILNNFKIIESESSSKDELFKMVCLSSLIQNIFVFQRACLKSISDHSNITRNLAWHLLQYLQINFSNGLDSSIVAKKFNITISKLNNSLRILTGENFSENLHRVKIRNACAMMAFDELSIQYISNFVGYKTSAAFYKAFKQFKKITPDNYRTKNSSAVIKGIFDISYSIILYIFENYNTPISITTASEHLYISAAKIDKILLSSFNKTFFQMLLRIRIQYACSLINATPLSISNIAYSVGFTSLRTFSRCFHSETGTNATSYRKINKAHCN